MESFDALTRSIGSQPTRRDALKAAFFSATGLALGALGIRDAQAAANCLCGRELFDNATQCCTPSGVRPKHPVARLEDCPNRVTHAGAPPCVGNGCGAEGGQAFPNSFGAASFLACCNNHDCCYGTCNANRANCDTVFENCLLASCDAAYPPSIATLPGGIQVDTNKVKRLSCRATAHSYGAGVRTERWGTPAYVAAQQAACDCCAAQACQTCPGGTCASLPPCQDPGCVCFQTIEGVGFCHKPQSCAGLANCTSSASCPAGWACVAVTCCGSQAICIRPCVVPGALNALPFETAPPGRMTDGSWH